MYTRLNPVINSVLRVFRDDGGGLRQFRKIFFVFSGHVSMLGNVGSISTKRDRTPLVCEASKQIFVNFFVDNFLGLCRGSRAV